MIAWLRRRCRLDRRGRSDDDGAVTIEYVILVPVVLVIIFSCFQLALNSFARSVAQTAAEEGSNAARAYGASSADGQSRAQLVIDRQGDALSNTNISVVESGGEVRVTVTGHSLSLLPGYGGFTVTQTASGPIEQFVR
jgi:Flp pilus assembly protein TadG